LTPFDDKPNGHADPAALGDCPDERLVELLVTGDHDAMGAIFDRYYRSVMCVALRIVRDPGEAEDVAQVAFTDFYRNAKLFDPRKGNLRTWLLQYAYGRSLNRLAGLKSRRHYDQVEYDNVEASALAAGAGERFGLTSQEARVFVGQALARLKEKQRRVIELVCLCGLTIAEVAEVTGDSVGNVQHRYYRGVERLRKEFSQRREPEAEAKLSERRSPWGVCKPAEKVLTREAESAKAQTF
jgi:RNA polymerase sigma-70 factor, ECF subfamily